MPGLMGRGSSLHSPAATSGPQLLMTLLAMACTSVASSALPAEVSGHSSI
jgi:hypothetical protein